MFRKIEYNKFDLVLRELVFFFFSSVLFVLILSTYTLADEINLKEVISDGRAVIIDGNKKLAKKERLMMHFI